MRSVMTPVEYVAVSENVDSTATATAMTYCTERGGSRVVQGCTDSAAAKSNTAQVPI